MKSLNNKNQSGPQEPKQFKSLQGRNQSRPIPSRPSEGVPIKHQENPISQPERVNRQPNTINKPQEPINEELIKEKAVNEDAIGDRYSHEQKDVNINQQSFNAAQIRESLQKQDEEIKERKAKELEEAKRQAEEAKKKAEREAQERKQKQEKKEKPIKSSQNQPVVEVLKSQEEQKMEKAAEIQRKTIQRGENYHQFKRLTVTEFYCMHYKLIKQIAESVLTPKYGHRMIKALSDPNERLKIEQESIAEVREYLVQSDIVPENDDDMRGYIKVTFAEILGFGILEFLLNDPEVDEVIVQRHDYILAEKHGLIQETEYKFPSYDAALGVARKIIQPLNMSLDFANPNVDGYLPNGSRLSASIPPLKADGDISITIRKFSEDVHPLMYYSEKYKSESPEMVKFIEMCVKSKKNIIVAGGTGSGKTTLLNSMSYAMGDNERIITIEETPELRIPKARVEPYLTVKGNNEGARGISIRDIVIHSLRKRPDRIVVGECRSGEIFEFLNAANTGHEGSTTSIHANSPILAFDRMENMMLQNEETKNMTHDAILRVLSSSVQLIIQVNRLDDGSRKVTQITEVLGYGRAGYDKLKRYKQIKDTVPCNDNMIYLRDVFRFKETSSEVVDNKRIVHGQFKATGYIPTFLSSLKMKGYDIDEEFFNQRVLMEV